jgi:hypothetical protein
MKEKIMFKIAKKSLIIAMIAAMTTMPLATSALAIEYWDTEDPTGGEMVFDFVVLRPVGLVATAIGSVFFVVSSPFAALGGNMDTAKEKLVKDPAAFTFKRPLGQF